MQHHQHATRAATAIAAAPHMRAPHHIPAMHANASVTLPPAAGPATTVTAINVPPQPPAAHHMASAAAQAQTTAAAGANHQPTPQQQQQHMRDHHARLQHQGHHIATQIHKLRQQNQHLNNNNNNNNNNNIGNLNKLKHQPPPQPPHYQQHPHINYNHINATQQHMGVAAQQQQPQQQPTQQQQQHRNVPYHNQPQHHKAVMPALPLQQMPPPMPPQKLSGTHKHGLPTLNNAPVPHQYYANNNHINNGNNGSNNKTKYTNNNYQNNNNNVNCHNAAAATATAYPAPPKQILQNPNRVLKPRQQTTAPTTPTHTTNHSSVTTTTTATTTTNTIATNADGSSRTDEHSNGSSNASKIATPVVSVLNAVAHSSDNKENELSIESLSQSNHNHTQSEHNSGEDCSNSNSSNANSNNNNNSCGHSTNGDLNHTNKKHNNNNNCNNILSNEDLSVHKNSKEKTPMCLVNELARYNKITHQYRLTNEKGPAHCKRFTVTLKLGEEEYSAEGYKIKKAQHLAAAEAIEKTKYKHPVPKAIRRNEDGNSARTNITPTVELNALAMKLGQQTYYLFDPRQMPPNEQLHTTTVDGMPAYVPAPHAHIMPPSAPASFPLPGNGMGAGAPPPPPLGPVSAHHHPHNRYAHAHALGHQRGMYPPKYPQRYPLVGGMLPSVPPPGAAHYAIPQTPCKITLIVGKQKFVGIGRTLQQAKHDAAARALQVLKTQSTDPECNEMLDSSVHDSDSKSPISMVHEIGIRRNMNVHFKVLREEGPAHMKNFITACVVGSIITEGIGNGKKISKKRAAEKMLEELKKLPPLTPTKSPAKRIKVKTPGKMGTPVGGNGKGGGRKRANISAIKENKDEDNANEEDNPITKLIQIQQNRKEKEPIFELISKNGSEKSRRREFIIEVTAQGMVARGSGHSKKLAKRNAAENLLIVMGLLDSKDETASDATQTNATTASNTETTNTTTQMTATSTNATMASTNTEAPTATTAPAAAQPADLAGIATDIDVPLITTPAGQVPGILILRQNKKHATKKKDAAHKAHEDKPAKTELVAKEPTASASTAAPDTTSHSKKAAVDSSKDTTDAPASSNDSSAPAGSGNGNPPAVQAKNIVSSTSNSGAANTATDAEKLIAATSSSSSATNGTAKSSGGVHMKDQLLYLAKLLGFEVNFSDYPKGNHSEFLTIVTLSSDPPQICHGVGANSEESQNDAAKNALKILSELGLNCAK